MNSSHALRCFLISVFFVFGPWALGHAAPATSLSARDIQMMLIWVSDVNNEAGHFSAEEKKDAVAKFRKIIASQSKGDLTPKEIKELRRLSQIERLKVGMIGVDDANTTTHLELPARDLARTPSAQKADRTEWKSSTGVLAAKSIRLTGAAADMEAFYNNIITLPGRKITWPDITKAVVHPDDKNLTVEGEYGGRMFHIRARKANGEVRAIQFSYPKTEVGKWRRVANVMMTTFEPFPHSGLQAAIAALVTKKPAEPAKPVELKPAPAKPSPLSPTASAEPAPRLPVVLDLPPQTADTDPRQQLSDLTKARVQEKRDDLATGHLKLKKKVALVLGNSKYTKPLPSLPNAKNDAEDIKTELLALNFDVVDAIDLGKHDLELKIKEFAKKLVDTDVAILYYAGHGLQVGGENWLIPIDADLKEESDLDYHAISVGFVLERMERNSPVNIVLLDACRDNPLPAQLTTSINKRLLQRPVAVARGLSSIDAGPNTYIAFAVAPGKWASDGEGRNSPFTAALKKYLREPGMPVQIMMQNVRRDVLAETGGKQLPWESSALVDGFTFNPL